MGKREIHPLYLYMGQRLRWARKSRGLSLISLSARVDLSYQQIQKLECGRVRLNARNLHELARALNINPGWFFAGYADAQNPGADLRWRNIPLVGGAQAAGVIS